MDESEFLIVHKSILPAQLEAVIEVREMVKEGNISVSDACKKKGISRSCFYKYKDYVYRPSKSSGSRAILALKTVDKKGVLSSILSKAYELGANVISINQDSPVNGIAIITLTIEMDGSRLNREELSKSFLGLEGVKKADIVGVR
ncbi:MAG: helix-turn-helix domain-containing protein [Bacilli bacterium]|nr:helix-turn-helix domain-containing protein [Bacilli bacterium]